jgi:mono/diheme cytochrome c family protein
MAIPDDSQIDLTDNGDFIFPLGSVLIKEFSFSGQKIETRLLMKNEESKWDGYTYQWNEVQTEASLLEAGKIVKIGDIQYQIPNRVQCQTCHTASVNGAIGPEYRQLNIEKDYSQSLTKNQIDYLTEIEFLDNSVLNKKEQLTALPDYQSVAFTDEERVNSFVHSNCSNCHNPQGTDRTSIDFSWQGTEQWGTCDKDPEVSSLDVENAKLMAAGDPERSIIYKRLNTTEPYKMPPIGRSTISEEVVELFHNYITNVECK